MPKKPQRSSSHRKSSVKSASKSAKRKRTHGRPHSPEADEVQLVSPYSISVGATFFRNLFFVLTLGPHILYGCD